MIPRLSGRGCSNQAQKDKSDQSNAVSCKSGHGPSREGRLKRHVTPKSLPKCMIPGRTVGATVAAVVLRQANFGLRDLAQPSQHGACNLDPASNLAVAKRGGCMRRGGADGEGLVAPPRGCDAWRCCCGARGSTTRSCQKA